MKLIDKAALVAEMERRKNICQGVANANENNEFTHLYYKGKAEAYSEMSEFLDTIEVKEIDWEKEWKEFLKDGDIGFREVAKHFYELGMQQSKNDKNNEEKK